MAEGHLGMGLLDNHFRILRSRNLEVSLLVDWLRVENYRPYSRPNAKVVNSF